ncbi:MAG: hypothetical protein GY791_13995 [Alphaproteobacteria bacterium]|nr:hypothetical protein [Alphaproteobacteria bacterium]
MASSAAAEPDATLEHADVRTLLDVAGLSDFRLLDAAQIENDWPDASFVWSNDAVVGDVRESVYGVLASYPIGVLADFDKVVRQVVIDWSKGCSGRPRVRMHARRTVGNGEFARRAIVECADSGGTFFSRAFFVGGDKTVFGFAHFFTDSGKRRGEAADDAMYRTFMRIIGN